MDDLSNFPPFKSNEAFIAKNILKDQKIRSTKGRISLLSSFLLIKKHQKKSHFVFFNKIINTSNIEFNHRPSLSSTRKFFDLMKSKGLIIITTGKLNNRIIDRIKPKKKLLDLEKRFNDQFMDSHPLLNSKIPISPELLANSLSFLLGNELPDVSERFDNSLWPKVDDLIHSIWLINDDQVVFIILQLLNLIDEFPPSVGEWIFLYYARLINYAALEGVSDAKIMDIITEIIQFEEKLSKPNDSIFWATVMVTLARTASALQESSLAISFINKIRTYSNLPPLLLLELDWEEAIILMLKKDKSCLNKFSRIMEIIKNRLDESFSTKTKIDQPSYLSLYLAVLSSIVDCYYLFNDLTALSTYKMYLSHLSNYNKIFSEIFEQFIDFSLNLLFHTRGNVNNTEWDIVLPAIAFFDQLLQDHPRKLLEIQVDMGICSFILVKDQISDHGSVERQENPLIKNCLDLLDDSLDKNTREKTYRQVRLFLKELLDSVWDKDKLTTTHLSVDNFKQDTFEYDDHFSLLFMVVKIANVAKDKTLGKLIAHTVLGLPFNRLKQDLLWFCLFGMLETINPQIFLHLLDQYFSFASIDELTDDSNQITKIEEAVLSRSQILSKVTIFMGYAAGYHVSSLLIREFFQLLDEDSLLDISTTRTDYLLRLFFSGLCISVNRRKYGIRRLLGPIIG